MGQDLFPALRISPVNIIPPIPHTRPLNTGIIQGDQEVSVHLMITVHSTGAQRLFDHPVFASESATFMELDRALSIIDV